MMETKATFPITGVRTGFWVNQNLQDPDFEFLCNVHTGVYDLMEYLHGSCTLFALALHDLLGLPMYCLADCEEMSEYNCFDPASPEFPLIHDFCVSGDIDDEDGMTVFVDCRGAISKEKAFLEEFRDFFDEYCLIQYTAEQLEAVRGNVWNSYGSNTAEQYYKEALNYIRNHINDYNIKGEKA